MKKYGLFIGATHFKSVQKFYYGESRPREVIGDVHLGKIFDILSLRSKEGYITGSEDSTVKFFFNNVPNEPYLTYRGRGEIRNLTYIPGSQFENLLVISEGYGISILDIGRNENRVNLLHRSELHKNTIKMITPSSIRLGNILVASYDNHASEFNIEKQKIVRKCSIGNLVWSVTHMKEDNVSCVGTGGLFLYSNCLRKRIAKFCTSGMCDIPLCHLEMGHYLFSGDDSSLMYCHDVRYPSKFVWSYRPCEKGGWINNMIFVDSQVEDEDGYDEHSMLNYNQEEEEEEEVVGDSKMIALSHQFGKVYFLKINPHSPPSKNLSVIHFDRSPASKKKKKKNNKMDVSSVTQLNSSGSGTNNVGRKQREMKMKTRDTQERIEFLMMRDLHSSGNLVRIIFKHTNNNNDNRDYITQQIDFFKSFFT